MKQIGTLLLLALTSGLWAAGAPEMPALPGTPRLLLIEDSESDRGPRALALLKEYADFELEVLPWKALKTAPIGEFDGVIFPSSMYKKEINGAAAYMPRILEAVEKEGTGLLMLNNYFSFSADGVPSSWTQGRLITVMPLHSDQTPLLPFAKALARIDEELEVPPFNTLYPDREAFDRFALTSLTAEAAGEEPLARLEEYEKSLGGRLAGFGWFVPSPAWEVLAAGATASGESRAAVIRRNRGKGRILLSAQYVDADLVNGEDPRAAAYLLNLIALTVRGGES